MATEKRLIDANSLVDWLTKHTGFRGNCENCTDIDCFDCIVENAIKNAPTVDAVEVVHGRWEPREDIKGFVRCSVCHDCNIYDEWPDGKKWNYCPNCGADMRERKDDVL